MILKEEIKKSVVCKECNCTQLKIMEPATYGCDNCKKQISSEEKYDLETTVFYDPEEDKEPAELTFCSWECLFYFLEKIQTTEYKNAHVISLPFLKIKKGDYSNYTPFINALHNLSKKNDVAYVIPSQKFEA